MMQDTTERRLRAEAPPRRPVSLRTRLVLASLAITLLAVGALGYYVFFRAQQSSAFIVNQLDTNVQTQAEDSLKASSQAQAASLDAFFVSARNNITDVGASAASFLAKQGILENGPYWDARDNMARIANGSWDNVRAGEPASVFIPSTIDLTDPLASEINTLKNLDFVVPGKLQANPNVVAMYFGGVRGETIYYPDIFLADILPPDFMVTQRPWFLSAAPAQNPNRLAVWSAPYLDAALHGLVVTVSAPVYDAGSQFRGVVAMDIQLNHIANLVSSIHAGQTGYAVLIDRDKRLIAMPAAGYADLGVSTDQLPLGAMIDQEQLAGTLPTEFADVLSRMSAGQTGLDTIRLNETGRYVAYEPIPEVGYSIALIVPSQELLGGAAAARQQLAAANASTTQFSLLLVALIMVFAAVAAVLLGNSLTRPLLSLTRTAQQFTAGNLDARAAVASNDEIGILGRTLNTMAANLQDLVHSLEQRVAERTVALERTTNDANRRATQFEAVTRVTSAINSIRNLDELMPQVAAVISQQFGYYHVGIFLNDDAAQTANLIAANSVGGKRMLARHHMLRIGEQGIVGYVAARGESRVARNVGEDAVFFNNPDLPQTRSEAALPLRTAESIIGVLDVQSTQEDAFRPEDLRILGVLADQVSLAIENARLFEATQRSLTEAETLYRQYVREAWQGLQKREHISGFSFTRRGSFPLRAGLPAPVAGRPRTAPLGEEPASVTIPIKLRGEVIGELIVSGREKAALTQDEQELAQAVADRVALSAENARLFEETSRRAERERLVTEITSKIRSSNNPEEMMRTALEELRRTLGAAEVQIIPQKVGEGRARPTEPLTFMPPMDT
jgi:GAF domain-containing protein/HAMP domain-containing protein